MSRDAEDGAQTDESAFSVFCFGPSDQVTAVRAYRVKVSQGGPKGYKGVVLDISSDLPIQQKLMRVYECSAENRTRVEMDVLQEIRNRHPELLVRRHPAQRDPGSPQDDGMRSQAPPEVNATAPVGHTPPDRVSAGNVSSLTVPMSLNEARRTATSIANDESNALPVQESVRNLAKVLATVLALIAEVVDEDTDVQSLDPLKKPSRPAHGHGSDH